MKKLLITAGALAYAALAVYTVHANPTIFLSVARTFGIG